MRLAASCSNGAEARMVCDLLRAAGIDAIAKGDLTAEMGDFGPYPVYVEDVDLERARAVLEDATRLSDDELAEAAEAAADQAPRTALPPR